MTSKRLEEIRHYLKHHTGSRDAGLIQELITEIDSLQFDRACLTDIEGVYACGIASEWNALLRDAALAGFRVAFKKRRDHHL